MLTAGIMAVQDGDAAFTGVDARRPPQQLEPGLCSAAKNYRFEYGALWPRHGVAEQAWGVVGTVLLTVGNWGEAEDTSRGFRRIDVTLEVGRRYLVKLGNADTLSTGYVLGTFGLEPADIVLAADDIYTPEVAEHFLWSATLAEVPCTTEFRRAANTCALGRYQDPDGNDCLILVTDEPRDQVGEDGGLGRAWRIQPGTLPVEIPLNGHDVWGAARLVPTYNGLILLRHGDARNYFSAAAVDVDTDTITLNTEAAFESGERVLFQRDGDYWLTNLIANTGYYAAVDETDNREVRLYDTPANAITDDGTGIQDLAGVQDDGRFYLQRAASAPGPFGNGAPPLLLQGTATTTAFEAGFDDVDADSAVTDSEADGQLTCTNHRLLTGDTVTLDGSIAGAGGVSAAGGFVRVLSESMVTVHPTVEDALLDTGALAVDTPGTTGTIRRAGASRVPMPGGREGVYFLQRNFIVNGRNNVLISDPLDPLHFTPMVAGINASLGEADAVMALVPLGDDTLLVLKENSVLALTGLSGERTEWRLLEITREYGCVAPLTARNVGSDVWFLSRRGVVSIARTVAGERFGVAQPASDAIQKYIDRIDWVHAAQATAEVWGNLYVLAAPNKGQEQPVNDLVLPYSFLNQAWCGEWCGATLRPQLLVRGTVFGEERLCFADADGTVRWFSDDFLDGDTDIATEVVSRGYLCGTPDRKLFLEGNVNVDTWQPRLTVAVQTPGIGESQTTINGRTYDRTQYLVYGRTAYDPENADDDFHAARRADYSVTLDSTGIDLGDGGISGDAHQNISLKFRCRTTDRYAQVVVSNTQGSARLNAIRLGGRTKALTAKETT